ncbi:MAG: squalene--hopene cyclase [Planctomycetaceae bacterium]|nr:squalene--hopene cyclase [Planctomycetaceae bacterium]
MLGRIVLFGLVIAGMLLHANPLAAEGEWETTPQGDAALEKGLAWLARNQGPEGNWESNDLGLVATGALAFLSAGHMPGRGEYGENVERAIGYVVRNAKTSGLLNAADPQRDMYNHGLSAFVLGQAYGMTSDARVGGTLDRGLKLIYATQAKDGGWDYQARRLDRGHDLSLVVMQAKAIRSAVDSGFEVPPEVVRLAIASVREHYKPANGVRDANDPRHRTGPGTFTYDGQRETTAMAAAGVVCLQEFGQYDDWRIAKTMDELRKQVIGLRADPRTDGQLPQQLDPYTLYYVCQALYQVGGKDWRELYPVLRERVLECQFRRPGDPDDGHWTSNRWLHGKPAKLYGTSVACFMLAIPNRYLPILQEGKIEGLGESLRE